MSYIFRTPVVSEGPIGEQRLFQFYQQSRGVTVLYDGTEFWEMRYPSEDTLKLAEAYWIGGHENIVDDEMAAKLTAAGYGDNLEPI